MSVLESALAGAEHLRDVVRSRADAIYLRVVPTLRRVRLPAMAALTGPTPVRRKRKARPPMLVVFGVLLMILPILNYFWIARTLEIHHSLPWHVLSAVHPSVLLFLAAPLPIGFGLLLVKRWAWRAFLVYGVALVIHNVASLLLAPAAYNAVALIQTAVGIAAILYFVQPDISAPYMRMHPRGWRMERRKPIEMEILVDGVPRRTRDVSERGVFVDWPDCPHEPNGSVQITIESAGVQINIEGGVVRVDPDGAGIAFRGADRGMRESLCRIFLRPSLPEGSSLSPAGSEAADARADR